MIFIDALLGVRGIGYIYSELGWEACFFCLGIYKIVSWDGAWLGLLGGALGWRGVYIGFVEYRYQ